MAANRFQRGRRGTQYSLGAKPMMIFAAAGGPDHAGDLPDAGRGEGLHRLHVRSLGRGAAWRGDHPRGDPRRAASRTNATKSLTSALDVQKLSSDQLVAAINARADAEGKAIKNSYASEVAAYRVSRALQVQTASELELARGKLLRAKAQASSPLTMLSEGGE
jgi:hypothetical protein